MKRDLLQALWRVLALCIVLELMLVAAILYFPDFEQNVPALRALAPLPVLRALVDQLEEGGLVAYVVGQQYFKACNTLGTAAAVLFACGAVAGEAQRGSLELWLSRPISRRRLLLERYFLGALALVLPVFATSASIPPLLEHIGESMRQSELFWCSLHESLFLLALYSLVFLLSTLGRQPLMIAFGALLFSILQFSIYLVERVTHYSLFRMTDVIVFMRIADGQCLEARLWIPLVGFNLACLLLALWCFERRNPN